MPFLVEPSLTLLEERSFNGAPRIAIDFPDDYKDINFTVMTRIESLTKITATLLVISIMNRKLALP